jgi:small subunit ribosomal protein S6
MRTYETMLLIEPTTAAKEWDKVVAEVDRVAKRNNATVVSLMKWGERKLSYPVKRNNRATFVLAYLQAEEKAVAKIRSDFHLSEVVIRHLIVQHEGEPKKEPPKDFETAGLVPRKPIGDDGDDRGTRSFGPPRFQR